MDGLVRLADLPLSSALSSSGRRVRAHRMARAGELERVHRGVYRTRRDEGDAAAGSPIQALAALLVPDGVLSHGSACALHRLGDPPSVTVMSVAGRRRAVKTRAGTILCLPVDPRRLLNPLFLDVPGSRIAVMPLERAVTDAVEAPRHAGGVVGVFRIVRAATVRLSWDLLIEELAFRRASAPVQRLGFLMDRRNLLSPERKRELLGLVRPGVKIHLGPRRGSQSLGFDPTWNVVVNVALPAGEAAPSLAPVSGPTEMDVALL